jgi:CIC family chloride channel protein
MAIPPVRFFPDSETQPEDHSEPLSSLHKRDGGLKDFSADRRLLTLAMMALVTGTVGAAVAWGLLRLINLVTNLAYYGKLSAAAYPPLGTRPLGLATVLVPALGCLVIGLMARYGSRKIRGHGIPEALEAILIGKSKIEPKVALLKPLSSAISIGSGGPFGAEGPIIMTGGALGSLLAQFFHLSDPERKTLLVAGAAAGMTAIFGTPVASVMLAIELLLFEWKPRSLVPVAVSAAVAAGWRIWAVGSGPLFPMVASALPVTGLPIAAGLGIVAGLLSILLTAMVYGTEDFFSGLPLHWMWWPAVGGVVVGLGGLIDPHALGVGYDDIGNLLKGNMVLQAALLLMVVKAVIWSVALGSGTSGGVLAPLLIIGGAFGTAAGHFLPVGDEGTWALVSMAAVMAGTMRAPLTATVFALELTQNINGFLVVLIGCTAAYATTVLLMNRSILTEKVARRGHHILQEYVVDPFEVMRVHEIMAAPVATLAGTMTIVDTIKFFAEEEGRPRHRSYPVVGDKGNVLGMVSRGDILGWAVSGWPDKATLAEAVADIDLTFGYQDEVVGRLADLMAERNIGRVPILNRSDGVLVGLVARRDLLRVRAKMMAEEQDRQILIGPGKQQRATPG